MEQKSLETHILEEAKQAVDLKNLDKLCQLIQNLKDPQHVNILSKAKMSKIFRQLLDYFHYFPNYLPRLHQMVQELISWTTKENKVYLKLYLQTRLISINLDLEKYHDALALSGDLMKELKKMDDKMMLLEINLLESRAYYCMKNFPKSRAALTTARTFANAIYVPPAVQAAIDLQSGILHCQDKDFKTGFSYFYEAFEGLGAIEDPLAALALKYMLLCKIMMNSPEDVQALINGKLALRYAGADIDAILAVAKAAANRSLRDFEAVLKKYPAELGNDVLIKSHLQFVYESLLEKNLLKIIEPFSHVQIAHLASLLELPFQLVEIKLGKMILDGVLNGMLDQHSGCLIVLEEQSVDVAYANMIQTMHQLDNTITALYKKASAL